MGHAVRLMAPNRGHAPFFVVILLLVASAFLPAHAAGKDPKASKSSAPNSAPGKANSVIATVVTDGAVVRSAPDLDACPIAQLAQGKKIRVSKKTTSGEVKFHKAAVRGRVGYIANFDIRIGSGPDETSGGAGDSGKDGAGDAAAKRKAKARKEAAKRRMSERSEPIYFARFVGIVGGVSEFKEDISGVDASASMPFYGLKVTGPDVIFGGPVVDFNFLLHYGAPTYYDALSAIKPTGFVLITDALFLLPVGNGHNTTGYVGVGPMLMLSQFTVMNAGGKKDLTEFNLGADFALGVATRIDKVALRVEAKYFLEKQSYKGLFASLQLQF